MKKDNVKKGRYKLVIMTKEVFYFDDLSIAKEEYDFSCNQETTESSYLYDIERKIKLSNKK